MTTFKIRNVRGFRRHTKYGVKIPRKLRIGQVSLLPLKDVVVAKDFLLENRDTILSFLDSNIISVYPEPTFLYGEEKPEPEQAGVLDDVEDQPTSDEPTSEEVSTGPEKQDQEAGEEQTQQKTTQDKKEEKKRRGRKPKKDRKAE